MKLWCYILWPLQLREMPKKRVKKEDRAKKDVRTKKEDRENESAEEGEASCEEGKMDDKPGVTIQIKMSSKFQVGNYTGSCGRRPQIIIMRERICARSPESCVAKVLSFDLMLDGWFRLFTVPSVTFDLIWGGGAGFRGGTTCVTKCCSFLY
jgi:hypothetical protein